MCASAMQHGRGYMLIQKAKFCCSQMPATQAHLLLLPHSRRPLFTYVVFQEVSRNLHLMFRSISPMVVHKHFQTMFLTIGRTLIMRRQHQALERYIMEAAWVMG